PEQAPPSPEYVPCLEHAEDEIVAEEQPYSEDASPNAQSPEYVLESDLEAHPKDDDDEDPEEDPVDSWSDSEIVRLLAMSSLPSSPLSPWSSPPPHIPFPSLPSILSPLSPVLSPAPPPSLIRSLGYRAAMIRLRAWFWFQKFLGTVKFGNDHVAKIMGYGDYQIGNVTTSQVYCVEGLGHNLFSIGQFCDSDLEVAFRQDTCFI
nr:integrase, catalytic region, zinc finger, CCHC-type, peptidase aspartic, catalytic [Tanacetum cinerariifolium]